MPTFFRSDGWVKATTGAAIPGAQIYVCTQPANVAFAPPTPLATIYSDVDGLVPITQPILTDGFGHYDFYVLPGTYTVVVALGGTIQQVYPDQSVGVAGGGTSGTVTSVGLTAASMFSVTGSPITTSGTIDIALVTQAANKIFGGPTTGAAATPTFRSLVLADLPSIAFSNLTGNIAVSQMNSGTNASSSTFWRGDGTWASAGVSTQSGVWTAMGASPANTQQASGFLLGNTSWALQTATAAATQATSTTPQAINVKPSSSLAGQIGGLGQGTTFPTNFQNISALRWKLKLNQTSSMRIWMGVTNWSTSSSFINDTLPVNFVGFRYSTNASDTKYQCVTCNASTQTTNAETTSSHVDSTTFHTFEIRFDGTNAVFYIDDTQVGSQSTNIPLASTNVNFQAFIDNVSVVGQPAYDIAWVTAVSRF